MDGINGMHGMRKIAGIALPTYVEDRKFRIQPCYLRTAQSKSKTLSHTSRRVLTRVMILMRFCFNSVYNHDPGSPSASAGFLSSLSASPPARQFGFPLGILGIRWLNYWRWYPSTASEGLAAVIYVHVGALSVRFNIHRFFYAALMTFRRSLCGI